MNRMLRRRTLAAVCVIALTLIVSPTPSFAQDALEEWEQNELRPLLDRLGAAFDGDVPTENPFDISVDFLKGVEGSIYAPFTVSIDPDKVTKSQVAMYLFVTPHAETGAAAAGAEAPAGDAEAPDPFENATYEDLFFVDVSDSVGPTGKIEIHRAFQAPPGSSDVYVVLRDSVGADGEEADLVDSMVLLLKEQIEVPNFWNDQLQLSSIIEARVLDLIDAPLSPEEQRTHPYTIGTTEIVPKRDQNFGKDENLSLLFYVYNPQLNADQTPDVRVEFDFYRVSPAGESFFNRTNPQEFNSQTWPAGVPVTGGIPSGQQIPLASFPASDYRLEIKVTDNVSGQSLTHDVRFTVNE